MKTFLFLTCCFCCLSVEAGTRNYLRVENASSYPVLLVWSGSVGTFSEIPASTSVTIRDIGTNAYPVDVYSPGVLGFNSLSYFPANSEELSFYNSGSAVGLYQVQLANLDGAGSGILDVNAAELGEYAWDFLQGLIVGSALAAVLFGYRYTKKALGWVDGGGE